MTKAYYYLFFYVCFRRGRLSHEYFLLRGIHKRCTDGEQKVDGASIQTICFIILLRSVDNAKNLSAEKQIYSFTKCLQNTTKSTCVLTEQSNSID